jgi:hypothetical protein
MYGHRRTPAIDMYFGRAVLNGKVSDMPGKYNMRSTGNILDIDKIIHENCFIICIILNPGSNILMY